MGNAYLIKDNSKEKIFLQFKSLANNAKVFILTREPPFDVKRFLGLEDIRCLWLTNVQVDYEHIRPQEIEQLSYIIERFISQNKKTAVLITGVEFIISYTSFEQAMHMIQAIKDNALINDCMLLVNIGIGTLTEQQMSLFEQEIEGLKIKS